MPIWEHLRHFVTGPQLPWVILWLGLATLIIGLIVLTRTSWGQSHPLRKCAVLSLLVHLLLAAYATTVQIVIAGSPDGHSANGQITITLADDADTTNSSQNAVWNQLTAGGEPIVPPAAGLARSESVPTVESQKPQLARETIAAASKPLLDQSPAEMAAEIKPEANAANTGATASAAPAHAKSAAPIDAAEAPQAVSAANVQPSALSPDRQPLTAPDGQSKPGDAAAALAGLPSLMPSTGPDAISPLDSADGAIHADASHGGTQGGTADPAATGHSFNRSRRSGLAARSPPARRGCAP